MRLPKASTCNLPYSKNKQSNKTSTCSNRKHVILCVYIYDISTHFSASRRFLSLFQPNIYNFWGNAFFWLAPHWHDVATLLDLSSSTSTPRGFFLSRQQTDDFRWLLQSLEKIVVKYVWVALQKYCFFLKTPNHPFVHRCISWKTLLKWMIFGNTRMYIPSGHIAGWNIPIS